MVKLRNSAMRTGAAFAVTLALAAGCASVAYAAPTVSGADYYGNGSVEKSTSIDVLSVDGVSQDAIYIQVQKDGRTIGDRLPYEFGLDENNQGGSTATDAGRGGVVSLNIDNLNLDGSSKYTVTAFADRDEKDALYTGTIYGVYAKLDNGTQQLIGAHTGDASALTYKPAEKLYVGGITYALDSSTPVIEGSAQTKIVYSYKSYVEAESAEGTIAYVDAKGNVVDTTTVAGVMRSESKTVDIPAVITTEANGKTLYYRTVFFKNQVTLSNPGQLNYTISCKYMGEDTDNAGHYYKAVIRAVDQDNNVVFTDTVNVTGKYAYTMPKYLYKNVSDKVNTYTLEGDSVLNFDAASDNVTTGARTIEVAYNRTSDEATEATVTFNLIDGTKAVGAEGRTLGTQTKQVSATNKTAAPEENITINGANYKIAGTAEKYAYTFGESAGYPVVNVYYVPENYVPSNGSYTVTVNYVNFLTNQVIKSESFQSSESDNQDHEFMGDEKFSQDGVDYVRLAGQEQGITHSYYSGIQTYTIYYRDVNDTLTSGTVINTIRVVYVDGTEGATTTTGTTTPGIIPAGTNATGTTTAGTTAGQLNAAGTYNVLDGEDNNQTLTNEAGVDSNTERIDDNETPLAAGVDSAGGDATEVAQGMPSWALPAGIGVAAVAVAGIMLYFMKRRSNKNELENA